MELNKIYNEDCLLTLGKMEDNSQVTGEPYKNVYCRVDEYTEENGRFVLTLNGTYHVGEVEDGVIYNR